MGNNNTKESRPSAAGDPRSRNRPARGDGAFLGITSSSQRERARQNVPFEHRETKQEREARRLERERATRLKERERSLREEHVDGGYLVTLGTYTGTEDFSKPIVRQLQVRLCRSLPHRQSVLVCALAGNIANSPRSNDDSHPSGEGSMIGLIAGLSISSLLLHGACRYPPPTNLLHPS